MSMNPKAAEALARPHALQMENREKLRLTGVSDVNGFDESLIVLTTDMGELSIRGEALHIDKIDLDAGLLELRGRIGELCYEETAAVSPLWIAHGRHDRRTDDIHRGLRSVRSARGTALRSAQSRPPRRRTSPRRDLRPGVLPVLHRRDVSHGHGLLRRPSGFLGALLLFGRLRAVFLRRESLNNTIFWELPGKMRCFPEKTAGKVK